MRKISADIVCVGDGTSINKGVIICNEEGQILNVLDPKKNEVPSDIEYYNGVLCPGFINAHCHLELSYLKNKIERNTFLHGFINELNSIRNDFSDEEIIKSIKIADQNMLENGIVAVGDISNTDVSFKAKLQSKIYYHTFLELFGLNPEKNATIISDAKQLKSKYHNLAITITPHAPYSLNTDLLKHIFELKEPVYAIHNQETASENELFKSKKGHIYDLMKKYYPNLEETFSKSNKSSLQSYLNLLPNNASVILVHNTFTSKKDFNVVLKTKKDIFWCFCPKANKFIENKLPDFNLFANTISNLVVGTDSLASNDTLSIIEELKLIRFNSDYTLNQLLQIATLNGAKALNIEEKYGSFAVSKAPGVNLITNLVDNNLSKDSEVKVIL
jgi:cytosine/adenosine deaminase-related metal-dependent hydrolase